MTYQFPNFTPAGPAPDNDDYLQLFPTDPNTDPFLPYQGPYQAPHQDLTPPPQYNYAPPNLNPTLYPTAPWSPSDAYMFQPPPTNDPGSLLDSYAPATATPEFASQAPPTVGVQDGGGPPGATDWNGLRTWSSASVHGEAGGIGVGGGPSGVSGPVAAMSAPVTAAESAPPAAPVVSAPLQRAQGRSRGARRGGPSSAGRGTVAPSRLSTVMVREDLAGAAAGPSAGVRTSQQPVVRHRRQRVDNRVSSPCYPVDWRNFFAERFGREFAPSCGLSTDSMPDVAVAGGEDAGFQRGIWGFGHAGRQEEVLSSPWARPDGGDQFLCGPDTQWLGLDEGWPRMVDQSSSMFGESGFGSGGLVNPSERGWLVHPSGSGDRSGLARKEQLGAGQAVLEGRVKKPKQRRGGGKKAPPPPRRQNVLPVRQQEGLAGEQAQLAGAQEQRPVELAQTVGGQEQSTGELTQPAGVQEQPTGEQKQPSVEQAQPSVEMEQAVVGLEQPSMGMEQPTGEQNLAAGEQSQIAGEQEQSDGEQEQALWNAGAAYDEELLRFMMQENARIDEEVAKQMR